VREILCTDKGWRWNLKPTLAIFQPCSVCFPPLYVVTISEAQFHKHFELTVIRILAFDPFDHEGWGCVNQIGSTVISNICELGRRWMCSCQSLYQWAVVYAACGPGLVLCQCQACDWCVKYKLMCWERQEIFFSCSLSYVSC